MLDKLVVLVLVAVAVERCTEILVDSSISESTIKRWLSLGLNDKPGFWYKVIHFLSSFGLALLGCGYCTSVWVAALFCAAAPQFFVSSIAQFVVMTLCLHGGANLYHVLYSLVQRGRVHSSDLNVTFKRVSSDESHSVGAGVISGADGGAEQDSLSNEAQEGEFDTRHPEPTI